MIKVDIDIDTDNRKKIGAVPQHLLADSIKLRLGVSC